MEGRLGRLRRKKPPGRVGARRSRSVHQRQRTRAGEWGFVVIRRLPVPCRSIGPVLRELRPSVGGAVRHRRHPAVRLPEIRAAAGRCRLRVQLLSGCVVQRRLVGRNQGVLAQQLHVRHLPSRAQPFRLFSIASSASSCFFITFDSVVIDLENLSIVICNCSWASWLIWPPEDKVFKVACRNALSLAIELGEGPDDGCSATGRPGTCGAGEGSACAIPAVRPTAAKPMPPTTYTGARYFFRLRLVFMMFLPVTAPKQDAFECRSHHRT